MSIGIWDDATQKTTQKTAQKSKEYPPTGRFAPSQEGRPSATRSCWLTSPYSGTPHGSHAGLSFFEAEAFVEISATEACLELTLSLTGGVQRPAGFVIDQA